MDDTVDAPLARACPLSLEAELTAAHAFSPDSGGVLMSLELRVLRVHADDRILMKGDRNRIDPHRWRPLIMNFCRFYGLGAEVYPSLLAEIREASYRLSRVQLMLAGRPVG